MTVTIERLVAVLYASYDRKLSGDEATVATQLQIAELFDERDRASGAERGEDPRRRRGGKA